MPDVARVLKQEMKRIAGKEMRAAGLTPKVKALSRRVRELEKRLKALEARPTPTPVHASVGAPAEVVLAKLTPSAIRKVRTKLGATQKALAKLLGVSHSTVYQWEAGRMTPGRKATEALHALESRPTPAPVQMPAAAEGGRFKTTPAAIKSIRARLGVSQAKFAKRLGVSRGAVYQWEAGRIKPGSKATASLAALDARPAAVSSKPLARVPEPRRKGRQFKATPAVLKRVRAKIGVTQAELAILLGVSHSAVAKWEAGRIGPRPETAVTLQALEGIGKREARRRLIGK